MNVILTQYFDLYYLGRTKSVQYSVNEMNLAPTDLSVFYRWWPSFAIDQFLGETSLCALFWLRLMETKEMVFWNWYYIRYFSFTNYSMTSHLINSIIPFLHDQLFDESYAFLESWFEGNMHAGKFYQCDKHHCVNMDRLLFLESYHSEI